jgi:kynureninase
MSDLARFRELFPGVRKSRGYFMTNSLGAMPSTVGPALQRMMETWTEKGAEAWEDWVPLGAAVGDQVGRLIGAAPGTVMMHLNISSIMAMLLTSFDFRSSRRNKIVYTDMDFPTLHYLADTWQGYGARIHRVPSRDGIGVDLDELLAAIDEETLLVPTCQVFFGSSYLQDIGAIARRAREVGARVCVDLYQSAGSMPVSVTEWGVDFAVGGSHKYFCGGTGAAYLYVRPDLLPAFRPRATGWLSHKRAFDMRIEPMDWADGIQRWMGGTPSVAPLYVAPCGYSILEEAGLGRIREESLLHTARILEHADRLGLEVRSPRDPARRGGSVHVRFPGVERAMHELKARGFAVHYRESYQGLRISPHFYNTLEEIDALMESIGEIHDSWQRGNPESRASRAPRPEEAGA